MGHKHMIALSSRSRWKYEPIYLRKEARFYVSRKHRAIIEHYNHAIVSYIVERLSNDYVFSDNNIRRYSRQIDCWIAKILLHAAKFILQILVQPQHFHTVNYSRHDKRKFTVPSFCQSCSLNQRLIVSNFSIVNLFLCILQCRPNDKQNAHANISWQWLSDDSKFNIAAIVIIFYKELLEFIAV